MPCLHPDSLPAPPNTQSRQPALDCLLALGDEELQDAWVLLEPRPEPEEDVPAAAKPGSGGRQQQQATAGGSGGWRTKRGAVPPGAPAAKRR